MNVEVFVLCDAATEWMGKLNILGTFDRIQVRELPAVHPQCTLAARIRFERRERGEHRIRITIVDSDGAGVVKPIEAKVNAQFPDAHTSRAFNFIVNLQQLRFSRLGEHSIDLAVDGRQEASLSLFLAERQGREG